jgi:hypothetical protein
MPVQFPLMEELSTKTVPGGETKHVSLTNFDGTSLCEKSRYDSETSSFLGGDYVAIDDNVEL